MPSPKDSDSAGRKDARPLDLPIGPRLEAVLSVAYRARRAVLLEGPTGIGKSEVVHAVARRLGLSTVVLDLSLLEPPDLVGLPVVHEGRTRFATPSILPDRGAGILLLEELNRAERYIQQPALQLLSARTLHDYVLPPDWTCFAAINPATGEYQTTPLDPALRARFLHLRVRADRPAWIAWALAQQLHPAVIALAQAHDRILDDIPPRTWTYVSQLLTVVSADERRDPTLMRDLLAGYLPPSWIETLLARPEIAAAILEIDVQSLLATYDKQGEASRLIRGYRERGETDRLDEIAHRLGSVLRGPEAGVLIARGAFSLGAFEALLADLPGDCRESLQEAVGGNATAVALLDLKPQDVLLPAAAPRVTQTLTAWKADPLKHHRLALLATAVRAFVQQPSRAGEIRKSNPQRAALGQLLAHLGERWGLALVETLQKLSITPIRPA